MADRQVSFTIDGVDYQSSGILPDPIADMVEASATAAAAMDDCSAYSDFFDQNELFEVV